MQRSCVVDARRKAVYFAKCSHDAGGRNYLSASACPPVNHNRLLSCLLASTIRCNVRRCRSLKTMDGIASSGDSRAAGLYRGDWIWKFNRLISPTLLQMKKVKISHSFKSCSHRKWNYKTRMKKRKSIAGDNNKTGAIIACIHHRHTECLINHNDTLWYYLLRSKSLYF